MARKNQNAKAKPPPVSKPKRKGGRPSRAKGMPKPTKLEPEDEPAVSLAQRTRATGRGGRGR